MERKYENNNKIGRRIDAIDIEKVETRKGWYKIKEKGFPWWLEFSKYYTYLPIDATIQFVEDFLKFNNIPFEKKEYKRRFYSATNYYIKISQNGSQFTFGLKVENSTDKTRALRVSFVLLSGFPYTLIYLRKIHYGEFDLQNFLNNLNTFLQKIFSPEYLQRVKIFRNALYSTKINTKIIDEILSKETFQTKIANEFKKIINYLFRTSKIQNENVSVAEFLSVFYKYIVTIEKSKISSAIVFIKKIVDELINLAIIENCL